MCVAQAYLQMERLQAMQMRRRASLEPLGPTHNALLARLFGDGTAGSFPAGDSDSVPPVMPNQTIVWAATRGTRTPLHKDKFVQIIVGCTGMKHFWLLPDHSKLLMKHAWLTPGPFAACIDGTGLPWAGTHLLQQVTVHEVRRPAAVHTPTPDWPTARPGDLPPHKCRRTVILPPRMHGRGSPNA